MTLIGAIDQGTSSSRFFVFETLSNGTPSIIAHRQIPVKSSFPQTGWVEQDPNHILETVIQTIKLVEMDLKSSGRLEKLSSIGITNQRETTVVWNKDTGEPLHNAIVWSDTRTDITVSKLLQQRSEQCKELQSKCGLPLSTYFSALKLRWLLDHDESVQEALKCDKLLFGTIDSWLVWKLSKEKVHITDVTNASRTMLMNLTSMKYDPFLLEFFTIPESVLPVIKSSSEVYGTLNIDSEIMNGVPIAGCLGDQQAALVGHGGTVKGLAKNTYGTGCFLLKNIGETPVFSTSGLLTTLAYQLGPDQRPVYALEGSIAVAGSLVDWLKDNLGVISSVAEVEKALEGVEDNGGVYFIPAFSGLFSPYWRPDARGTILGLTQYTRKEHLIRAAMEAVCFQTKEIAEAMFQDSGIPIKKLLVDGGMSQNNALMKIQADILGVDTIRPDMNEMTALGAAIVAGHAIGISNLRGLANDNQKIFKPTLSDKRRDKMFKRWKMAVERSFNWIQEEEEEEE